MATAGPRPEAPVGHVAVVDAVEDLVPLAVYAITETASQDGKGGAGQRGHHRQDRGCQVLTDDQVGGIIEANVGVR